MDLKYTHPNLSLSNNIAIVGSSGILKHSNLGEEIDLFEDVIRCNRAPVEGFENDVGNKTTLRVVNQHVFRSELFTRWKTDDKFVTKLRNTKILIADPNEGKISNKDKYIHNSVDLFMIKHKKARQIIKDKFSNTTLPTVGFLIICLVVLSEAKPHIYGFDVNPRQRDHYYEERDNKSPWHKPSEEAKILKELHKQGKIIIHGQVIS